MIDTYSATDRDARFGEFKAFMASSIKEQVKSIPDFGEPRVGVTLPRGREPSGSCQHDELMVENASPQRASLGSQNSSSGVRASASKRRRVDFEEEKHPVRQQDTTGTANTLPHFFAIAASQAMPGGSELPQLNVPAREHVFSVSVRPSP